MEIQSFVTRAMPKNLARAMLVIIATGVSGGAWASYVVAPGFDLLETVEEGTFFAGVNWVGVPDLVGDPNCANRQFDFGSGCVGTGTTDSIIQRLDEASVGGDGQTATIDIELVALSLRSVEPVNIFGVEEHVSARVLKDLVSGDYIFGGNFGSSMSITFDDMLGGTFTSVLNFLVDLIGEVSQQVASVQMVLTQDDAGWGRVPDDESWPRIRGVNRFLNGSDDADDFWSRNATHCDVDKCHETMPIDAPIPAALPLLAGAISFLGVIAVRRRRNDRA